MGSKMVLVVCNGNIHRSVIAQICLNREVKRLGLGKKIVCVSAGLQGTFGTSPPKGRNLRDYELEWRLSAPTLRKLQVEVPESQKATPVDEEVIVKATLILAMDRGVLNEYPVAGRAPGLLVQFPKHGYKMRLFRELEGRIEDVPDCWGQNSRRLYEQTIRLIDRIARLRINTLVSLVKLFSSLEEPFEDSYGTKGESVL